MTIGGLAKTANVNVETIRYYQRRDLLKVPERHFGAIRRYTQKDVARMRFIKTAQNLGFSLDEIAELLRLDDGSHCFEASHLAQRRLSDVRDKIANLRRIEIVLDELVTDCAVESDNVTCPLITSLHHGLTKDSQP
jgi:MerR family mercuric resistance operon transcriptional regulator